jgi:hypothetical protein
MSREESTVLKMVEACIKKKETAFLAKLILKLQKDYLEVAKLSSDGRYKETWTHANLLDYLTKGEL